MRTTLLERQNVVGNLGELKLQWDLCERWISDAGKSSLMLLCDVASLIRLSITIGGLRTSRFWKTLVNKSYRDRTGAAIAGRLYHSAERCKHRSIGRYWFILSPEVQISTSRLRLSGADKLQLVMKQAP